MLISILSCLLGLALSIFGIILIFDRVDAIAREAVAQGWVAHDEVILTAGGSAIFDLVAERLTPDLGRPVRGVLRSGCYLTHDHQRYTRYLCCVGERLNLRELMLQPEMLEHVQPDVHMVADLISLGSVIPQNTKETARIVVRKVVDDLMRRLEEPMRSAVSGALDRSQRNRRPRHSEIDWNRTIRANLRHWQPDYRTIVPETLVGYGRKVRRPQREVILCIDQSGSMANSVVYSSIFGAVMASLPAVATRLVVFDTAVVDLTDKLSDPVDVLFGVQLGGGTDINRAVGYCQGLISEPRNAIVVLISDLYEGGVESGLLRRASELVESGVQFITLLALSDEGAPAYDAQLAAKLAALGVPSFACTPDAFPQLMAAAIRRDDVAAWAAGQGFKTSK